MANTRIAAEATLNHFDLANEQTGTDSGKNDGQNPVQRTSSFRQSEEVWWRNFGAIVKETGMDGFIKLILLLSLFPGTGLARAARAPAAATASAFSAASINLVTTTSVGPGASGPAVLRAEILLDRAHFSCGQIDGQYGQNLKNAIEAYQLANQLTVDGVVGASVWQLLNQDSADAVVEHTISAEDVAGPFDSDIPTDMVARSKLKGMYYASALQEFTGKYHTTEALLNVSIPGRLLTAPARRFWFRMWKPRMRGGRHPCW